MGQHSRAAYPGGHHQASGRKEGYQDVLGLARTGLIFTGLQEGAQPGGGG